MPCPSFHYPVLLCRWYAQIDPIKKTVHTCRIYRFLGLVCPVNSHFIGILSKFTHVHFRGRYSQSLCFLNYRTIVASLFYECLSLDMLDNYFIVYAFKYMTIYLHHHRTFNNDNRCDWETNPKNFFDYWPVALAIQVFAYLCYDLYGFGQNENLS